MWVGGWGQRQVKWIDGDPQARWNQSERERRREREVDLGICRPKIGSHDEPLSVRRVDFTADGLTGEASEGREWQERGLEGGWEFAVT